MVNLLAHYQEFLKEYDTDAIAAVWRDQSNTFRRFWRSRVCAGGPDLSDQEIDDIVKILDSKAKGNTKENEAVAKVMIPQGVWRRMFNEIHKDPALHEGLTAIFEAEPERRADLIDRIYDINADRKNSLTGKSANALNAFLAAWDPEANLSIVSLNDRSRLLQFLAPAKLAELESASQGEKVVKSNHAIVAELANAGLKGTARTYSVFVYWPQVRVLWRSQEDSEKDEPESIEPPPSIWTEEFLFQMESHLEDFLIENWDRTELGQKYDLIQDDENNISSQQYRTDIGVIDILARDKETGKHVVIELKKNQTSDDTIGQLARYMGWVEEHVTGGKKTLGVIIAGKFDDRLYYASKKLSDVELYIYQVDFRLAEFSRQ